MRIVERFLGFCNEKKDLHRAGEIAGGACTTKLVGFDSADEQLGQPLVGIRGFKGYDELMWRNLIGDNLRGRYSVLITTFDSDDIVTGSMEILNRRVRG